MNKNLELAARIDEAKRALRRMGNMPTEDTIDMLDTIDAMRAELSQAKERLHSLYEAANVYYTNYCQDEAEDQTCCVVPIQHEHAKAFRDALAVERSK